MARLITTTCARGVSSSGVNPRPWISRAPIAGRNPGGHERLRDPGIRFCRSCRFRRRSTRSTQFPPSMGSSDATAASRTPGRAGATLEKAFPEGHAGFLGPVKRVPSRRCRRSRSSSAASAWAFPEQSAIGARKLQGNREAAAGPQRSRRSLRLRSLRCVLRAGPELAPPSLMLLTTSVWRRAERGANPAIMHADQGQYRDAAQQRRIDVESRARHHVDREDAGEQGFVPTGSAGKPPAAASRLSNRLSIRTSRRMCPRRAPSARRTAISGCRPMPRASMRPATFCAASTSRVQPAASKAETRSAAIPPSSMG